jgi:hypothetical protein
MEKEIHQKRKKNKRISKGYTSAGIRTRVRALATPGDDRYTTDVLSLQGTLLLFYIYTSSLINLTLIN